MTTITLTKHHGLGNDFLIAIDPTVPLQPAHAVAWCHRQRGIGADGLIMALVHPDDPRRCTMTLWNADGSRAELSGNGLRCLGQALAQRQEARAGTEFEVLTDAGARPVVIEDPGPDHTARVAVDMGRAKPGPAPWARWATPGVEVHAELGVDMGNPHLVCLVDDPEPIDLGALGPLVEADYADGLNLELITVGSRSALSLRVWERGAGLTQACGSGACAAAWAASRWELVDHRVEVAMPGGAVTVEIVDGDGLRLIGDATYVATITLPAEVEAGDVGADQRVDLA